MCAHPCLAVVTMVAIPNTQMGVVLFKVTTLTGQGDDSVVKALVVQA